MIYNGFKIDKVVMVDDSFISSDTYIENIPKEVVNNTTFYNEFEEFIDCEENKNKTLKNFFLEEQIKIADQEFFFENLNYEYKPIESFFKEVEIVKYHPKEFDEKKLNQYKNTDDTILFILDKKLSDDKYEITLKNILEKVSNLLKEKNNCFLFIYSSEVEEFSNHKEVVDYLFKQLNLSDDHVRTLSMHMNFVEKNSYLDNSLISTAIRKSQKANYLFSFYKIQEDTMDAMNNRIWNINNNELLVHYNYLSEGQHIDEILFDIYQSKFSREYENSRRNNFDKLVKPMRESIQSYVSTHDNMNYYSLKSRIIKELNNEFNRNNNFVLVNESDDISYGDVIRIDDIYYLVLSQQCDITIRANGTRNSKEFLLLEIEEGEITLNALNIYEKIRKIVKFNKSSLADIANLFDEQEFIDLIDDAGILNELRQKNFNSKHRIQETEVKHKYNIFKYKKNAAAYYIPSFILDSQLLPKQNESIEVTEKIITSCKSIRHSTKLLLLDEFQVKMEEINNLIEKIQDEDIIGRLLFPKLKCEVLRNGEKLVGIRYNNISRIGRLDSISTSEIHEEYSKHLLRAVKNEAPIL